jgi:lysophospholipase L1-like esterase
LDGIHPRAVVILIGTNDLGGPLPVFYQRPPPLLASVAAATEQVVKRVREGARREDHRHRHPAASRALDRIDNVNRRLIAMPDVIYLDLGSKLAGPDGLLKPEYSIDGLHLTDAGYQGWADMLQPMLPSNP